MTIPQQLAFPPSALRGVTAGGVVGNEIGSSGTRGKVLSSAQLKAIVEASGIRYLPLSGGTLTGPITGTGGLIEQRDGLMAQCLDIFETYTSGTNNGKLRFKATSGGHQIGSAVGSSGGSNRAVQIGHFNSGGTFSGGLTVATNGNVTASAVLLCSGFFSYGYADIYSTAANTFAVRASGYSLTGSSATSWLDISGTWNTSGAPSAILLNVTNTASGANAKLLDLQVGGSSLFSVSKAGALVFVPASSVTLGANGQFGIEMTSSTAGNLVYRGSDGTTRRMALTFS